MNHIEVEATRAVERYLVGEMNEGEELEFEEHYFECCECADDVRLSSIFLANLKAVLREPYPLEKASRRGLFTAPAPRRWMTGGAIAAAVMLAAGMGYQNLVQLPQLRRELALANAEDSPPTYYLAQTRSEGDTLVIPSGTRHVSLLLNPMPGRTYPFYDFTLEEESGKTVRSFRVRGPVNQEEWQIRLSTEGLGAQSYALKLRGLSTASGAALEPVAEYHFKLEYR
jgi:hypothetical protein